MGLTPRLQVAGCYHVMARSINQATIFRTQADFAEAINTLAQLVSRKLVVVHGFCFLPTHYHFVGTFEEGLISVVQHRLNRRIAVVHNRRYLRRGRVFDAPYASVPVADENHMAALARYLADNPAARPWAYSSFDTHFDFVDDEPFADVFGSRRALEAFVAPDPRTSYVRRSEALSAPP